MSAAEFRALRRRSLDAATRFRRATRGLYGFVGSSEAARTLAGFEAAALLSVVLEEAELLIDCLDPAYEDDLERLERAAADLRSALRRHRLAAKLAASAGRTPEEVATFETKARELSEARRV